MLPTRANQSDMQLHNLVPVSFLLPQFLHVHPSAPNLQRLTAVVINENFGKSSQFDQRGPISTVHGGNWITVLFVPPDKLL